MDCPRCKGPLPASAPFCSTCGFSLAKMDGQYGGGFVILERITDGANCLSPDAHAAVQAELDDFERQFPYLFVAVYADALPAGTQLHEFGFWLLNRAAVRSVDYARPNENGILLCLDVNNRTAALTTGYTLERYLPQDTLHAVLMRARKAFWSHRWEKGITTCVHTLAARLRKLGEISPPTVLPETGGARLPRTLPNLRASHQHQGESGNPLADPQRESPGNI